MWTAAAALSLWWWICFLLLFFFAGSVRRSAVPVNVGVGDRRRWVIINIYVVIATCASIGSRTVMHLISFFFSRAISRRGVKTRRRAEAARAEAMPYFSLIMKLYNTHLNCHLPESASLCIECTTLLSLSHSRSLTLPFSLFHLINLWLLNVGVAFDYFKLHWWPRLVNGSVSLWALDYLLLWIKKHR